MKNYFAKKSWASYLLLGTLIFALIAIIFSVSSDTNGASAGSYAVGDVAEGATHGGLLSTVIACNVVAMVLALIAFAVDGIYINAFINKILSIAVDVVRIVIGVCLLIAMSYMISTRGTLMGFVWFSSLASGSVQAVAALNNAVVSWVMSVLAIVCLCVSCGFNLCEKKTKVDTTSAVA